MVETRIAARYARALFSLAYDRGLDEEVRKDLAAVQSLRDNSLEFGAMLSSPAMASTAKIRLLGEVLSGLVNDLTIEFLDLLVGRRREAYLDPVVRLYDQLLKEKRGIVEAKIVTARPISEAMIEEITAHLAQSTHADIVLSLEIREELIGGLILQVEDQQLDASILRQLKTVRKELSESKY